jgi:hypothetical protein
MFLNEQDILIVGMRDQLPSEYESFGFQFFNNYGMKISHQVPVRIQKKESNYWNENEQFYIIPLKDVMKDTAYEIPSDLTEIAWIELISHKSKPRKRQRVDLEGSN